MRYLLIILSFHYSSISVAQIGKQVNSVLLKHDFDAFLSYAKSCSEEKDGYTIEEGNIREITTGYQEAMFEMVKSYQMNPSVSFTANSKIKVLTYKNRVIYFFVENKEMKGFPKNFVTSNDTTFEYIDNAAMLALRKQYFREYGAELRTDDLFIDTISVGTKCGRYPGVRTSEFEQILKWISSRDTANLDKWLQSPNAEKQVYSIIGFYNLHLKGYKLSEETLRIVDRVRRKRGTVNTCIPCDGRERQIAYVLEDYKF